MSGGIGLLIIIAFVALILLWFVFYRAVVLCIGVRRTDQPVATGADAFPQGASFGDRESVDRRDEGRFAFAGQ